MSDTMSPPTDREEDIGGRSWLDAEVDGRPVGFWVLVAVVIAVVTLGFGVWWGVGNRGRHGDGR